MSKSIPPLLQPYLALPSESSLILLTSVLGASPNWLILRYIHSLLLPSPSTSTSAENEGPIEPKILFVSFLRDLNFWRENGRKIGLDLDKLHQTSRLHFVDGLSGLHLPASAVPNPPYGTILRDSSPDVIFPILSKLIATMQSPSSSTPIILIIDSLDYLLSCSAPHTPSTSISSHLLSLRSLTHSTILSLSADSSLLSSPSSQPLTSLLSSFTLSLAHDADMLISVRELDTGAARDVSGVLRVTRGGQGFIGYGEGKEVEEKELLYFVGGDGGVRVFERGQ
ncbi:hypothetical protein CJF32_00010965 [Rutstroemia sp. NJR-2017a WRK4]|nr:hypothetical protein CJF32_00010965 [Rutstroemia sp. NJR-2017a WRK4]